MKANWIRNTITYLFLALFLTTKMAGLHALSHTNEENHGTDCAICIHINTNNLTPAINPDLQDFTIVNIEFVVQKEEIKSYSFFVSNIITTDQLFSRPPPFLV